MLLTYVEDLHRWVCVYGSVVHREDVRARQGEHGVHAVRLGDGYGMRPGVCFNRSGLSRSCMGVGLCCLVVLRHGDRLLPRPRGSPRWYAEGGR